MSGPGDEKAAVFIGSEKESGNDGTHLDTPMSVAVDKDGNIYVADKGNDRIAVFKPNGSFLGALKVDKPERVEVHPKTGAVYVLGGKLINQLRKFASWKDSKAVAETAIPSYRHKLYTAMLALDASAELPVLWIAPHTGYAGFALLRIEDKGNAFGKQVKLPKKSPHKIGLLGNCWDVGVDNDRDEVYVVSSGGYARPAITRFSGRTGKRLDARLLPREKETYSYCRASMGNDGLLYLDRSGKKRGAYRYNVPSLKPAPYTGTDSNRVPLHGGRLRSRGMTGGPDGKVYVLWQVPHDKKRFQYDPQASALAVCGPDGEIIKERLIDSDLRSLNSVQVDAAGNIYLAIGLRPGKEILPPGLKGKLPEGRKDPDADGGVNCYPLIYGSIVKFGPEGGVIRKGVGGTHCNYAYGAPVDVKGAKWFFTGASNVPSWRTPGTPNICLCESPSFSVDGFGRSFFPDAGRFRVGVIDTNGNPICWFGSYGNQDSAGPDSAVPVPEIPFTWVSGIGVSDKAAYVGDRLSRRIVRVKLTYAAEEICPVP